MDINKQLQSLSQLRNQTKPYQHKMYNKKGKVHPSPPSAAGHLSLLPAALLTLAASLSAEDKQILAYLISCCGGGNTNPDTNGFSGHRKRVQKKNTVDYSHGGAEHDPVFECNCFNCYLSYWARWDVSPNRQLIDEIIEAYEEWLMKKKKKSSRKKKEKKAKRVSDELKKNKNAAAEEKVVVMKDDFELVEKNSIYAIQQDDEDEDVEVDELEKSIVRKISSFVGERIWGFWGIN